MNSAKQESQAISVPKNLWGCFAFAHLLMGFSLYFVTGVCPECTTNLTAIEPRVVYVLAGLAGFIAAFTRILKGTLVRRKVAALLTGGSPLPEDFNTLGEGQQAILMRKYFFPLHLILWVLSLSVTTIGFILGVCTFEIEYYCYFACAGLVLHSWYWYRPTTYIEKLKAY